MENINSKIIEISVPISSQSFEAKICFIRINIISTTNANTKTLNFIFVFSKCCKCKIFLILTKDHAKKVFEAKIHNVGAGICRGGYAETNKKNLSSLASTLLRVKFDSLKIILLGESLKILYAVGYTKVYKLSLDVTNVIMCAYYNVAYITICTFL